MVERNVQKLYSDKNLTILFSLWLISYFFGSKIGNLSTGIITIYPNFILSLFFIPLIFSSIRKYESIYKAIILVYLAFVLYCVIWIVLNGASNESVFDMRSHLFNLFTFLIITSTYQFFKSKKVIENLLKNILWIWLVGMVIFGVIEIVTGFHFSGNYSKSITGTAFKLIDFAPVFIFDNPNDFLLNCIGVLLILLFVDKDIFNKKWLLITALFSLFILSIYAASRISQLVILLLFVVVFYKFYLKEIKDFFQENRLLIGIFSICFLVLVGFNSIFFGKDPTNVNSQIDGSFFVKRERNEFERIDVKNELNEKQKEKLAQVIIRENKNPGFNSSDIRKKLTQNGIFLFKSNPVFGVGPGQFGVKCSKKEVPYDVGENVSPHNFVMELISQYGFLAIGYFAYIFFLLTQLIRYRTENSFWLCTAFVLFASLSLLPSAFNYQPIYWLFMATWIIFVSNEKEMYFGR